jgi:uncharacterized membrane protein (DUF373 family)
VTPARDGDATEDAEPRQWIARAFSRFEDVVYIGLALLLAGSALGLLVHAALTFVQTVVGGQLSDHVVALLDRLLLILMVVELLYTVQISFREHALKPEPFLIVGLIAAMRRILILTAEFKLLEEGGVKFRNAMIELGLLTVLVVALVVSLGVLRRRAPDAGERAKRS